MKNENYCVFKINIVKNVVNLHFHKKRTNVLHSYIFV